MWLIKRKEGQPRAISLAQVGPASILGQTPAILHLTDSHKDPDGLTYIAVS